MSLATRSSSRGGHNYTPQPKSAPNAGRSISKLLNSILEEMFDQDLVTKVGIPFLIRVQVGYSRVQTMLIPLFNIIMR